MAFSYSAVAGAQQFKAASATTVYDLSGDVTHAVGSLIVLWVAKDNTSTSDGDNSEVTSVTDDAGGNTWVKAKEYANGSPGSASGACCSVWYCVLSTQLLITNKITANHASCTARTIGYAKYTFGAGSTISVAGSNSSEGTTTVPSLTLSGLAASTEYLYFRATAIEDSAAAITVGTASWQILNGNQTAGGGGATNMAGNGEHRIVTATSATSAPTGTASGDNANVIVAFKEVTPAVYRFFERPAYLNYMRN